MDFSVNRITSSSSYADSKELFSNQIDEIIPIWSLALSSAECRPETNLRSSRAVAQVDGEASGSASAEHRSVIST